MIKTTWRCVHSMGERGGDIASGGGGGIDGGSDRDHIMARQPHQAMSTKTVNVITKTVPCAQGYCNTVGAARERGRGGVHEARSEVRKSRSHHHFASNLASRERGCRIVCALFVLNNRDSQGWDQPLEDVAPHPT